MAGKISPSPFQAATPSSPLLPPLPSREYVLALHLRDLVRERDQTRLGGALLLLLRDVLQVGQGACFTVLSHKGRQFVSCRAEMRGGVLLAHGAHLAAAGQRLPLDDHQRLKRCVDTATALLSHEGALSIHTFPLLRQGAVCQLVEIERATALAADELGLADLVFDVYLAHQALIDYAETDTLTGLLNRKTFDEHLDRVLAAASSESDCSPAGGQQARRRLRPEGARNWLAVIDIDHFKRVNDSYGHLIGDEVLLLLAQLMRDSFRLDDQMFRFGGEEFVVVLQPTGLAEATMVLERFRRTVEQHAFPMVGQITVSLGFTHIDYFDNPTDLIDRADKALYFAKENGRNRVENFEALHEAGQLGADRGKSDIELF